MKIVFAILLLLSTFALSQVQEINEEQQAEWQRLYPKLNSKMARMEEILNYVDRFRENQEFKKEVLTNITEFIFLAQQAQKNIPDYLSEEDQKPYKHALIKTASLGSSLFTAVDKSNFKQSKQLFLALDKLRRKSHAAWAE